MQNPLTRIIVTFILIALLPISFIVYEFNSLNKNEEIVREIYRNQLEAILYSVNQYTDDVMSSWANRINITINEKDLKQGGGVNLLTTLSQLNAVKYIYLSGLKNNAVVYSLDKTHSDDFKKELDELVRKDQDRINRLLRYDEAGFKKLEPAEVSISNNLTPVFFVLDKSKTEYKMGIMVIDLKAFIQNTLGPKMQNIAQDKFIISALQQKNDSVVYATSFGSTGGIVPAKIKQDFKDDGQKKEFWLLPGYYLGISLQGATIDDLVRERVITSLGILIFLMLLLLAGLFFLYRNIKRELNLSQAKSEFVSNVSHEIRTPLSLISMYAETLEMGRVNEEKKKEYYNIIIKETARLTRIVNRILNFSQVEANKKRYHFESVQLNDLCKEISASYFFPLKDKGFNCECTPDDTLMPIEADKESLTEAIMNLLDNAVKYSKDNKSISIKTGCEQKYCYIEVKDNGIGISKNHQQEIFNQFYRVPSGDVHNTKGSGLGLTLVRKTVEAHHGKIKVESTPGKGSTFRLYFPINNKPS